MLLTTEGGLPRIADGKTYPLWGYHGDVRGDIMVVYWGYNDYDGDIDGDVVTSSDILGCGSHLLLNWMVLKKMKNTLH